MLWTTCMPRPWTLSPCLSLFPSLYRLLPSRLKSIYVRKQPSRVRVYLRYCFRFDNFVNFLRPRSRSSSNDTMKSSLDFPNIPDTSPMQIEIFDRGKVTHVTSSLNLKSCGRETESTRWTIKICPSATREWKIAQNHASRNANRRSPVRLGTN